LVLWEFCVFINNNNYENKIINFMKEKERILLGIFSSKKKYATVKADDAVKQIKPLKSSNLWVKCDSCNEILLKKDIDNNHKKCPNCDFYFNMSAEERVQLLIDEGTFIEFDRDITSKNPLDFPGYEGSQERSKNKTGLNEGVVSGTGKMNGMDISIAVMEFKFMGGSMGSVVGEKITRAIERGLENNTPVVVVSSSGGARMHEGILSLMQMAKTSAALERLREKKLPFISIPVNPTTGGVTASFAMLGDVIISEPGAQIGFAGARVIEQTIKQKLPEGFQTSEFLLEHGMVDIIAKREELKETVYKVLSTLC
jgi:acetyl-CoA carboxylase carboxyl transferase subunit beta